MNLYLIGLPGVGKTTVGAALADRLQWSLVDLDRQIETVARTPIAQIFAESGEAEFRALESQQLRLVAQQRRTVVATGGGVVCSEQNILTMQHSGKLVFLDDTIDNIRARLGRNQLAKRPILGSGSAAELIALAERRRPAYLRADVRLDVSSMSVLEVVDAIRTALLA